MRFRNNPPTQLPTDGRLGFFLHLGLLREIVGQRERVTPQRQRFAVRNIIRQVVYVFSDPLSGIGVQPSSVYRTIIGFYPAIKRI